MGSLIRRVFGLAKRDSTGLTVHDPEQTYKRFFNAIFNGKLSEVEAIIDKNGGTDFLHQNVDGFIVNSSLGGAIWGTADIVQTSPDGGVKTANCVSGQCGIFGVMCAIYKGRTEIAEYLLDHGVDPNSRIDDEWNSALIHKAIVYHRYGIVKALLDRGVDPNTQDNSGITCVAKASPRLMSEWGADADETKLKIIELLGERGAKMDIVDSKGYTPLYLAATWYDGIWFHPPERKGGHYFGWDFEVDPSSPTLLFMDVLIRYGADPDFYRSTGLTFGSTPKDAYEESVDTAKNKAAKRANEDGWAKSIETEAPDKDQKRLGG